MSSLPATLLNFSRYAVCFDAIAAQVGFEPARLYYPFMRTIRIKRASAMSNETLEAKGLEPMHKITCADSKIIPQFNKYSSRLVRLGLYALQKDTTLCEFITLRARMGGSEGSMMAFISDLILREAKDVLPLTILHELVAGITRDVVVSNKEGHSAVATMKKDGVLYFHVTTEAQLVGLIDSIRGATLKPHLRNMPTGRLHIMLPAGAIPLLEKDILKRNCCSFGSALASAEYGADAGVYSYTTGMGANVIIHTNIPDAYLIDYNGKKCYYAFWDDRMTLTYVPTSLLSLNHNPNNHAGHLWSEGFVSYRLSYLPDGTLVPVRFQMFGIFSIDRTAPYAACIIAIDDTVLTTASTGLLPGTPAEITSGAKPAGIQYDEPDMPTIEKASVTIEGDMAATPIKKPKQVAPEKKVTSNEGGDQ